MIQGKVVVLLISCVSVDTGLPKNDSDICLYKVCVDVDLTPLCTYY